MFIEPKSKSSDIGFFLPMILLAFWKHTTDAAILGAYFKPQACTFSQDCGLTFLQKNIYSTPLILAGCLN